MLRRALGVVEWANCFAHVGSLRPQRYTFSRTYREGRPASLLSDGEARLVGNSLPRHQYGI